jgi:hypothetical protein
MSRKKISTTIYVTPEQSEKLKLLHERTKVPVAVYIREGIDLVLRHYGHLLPGQLPLDGNSSGTRERAERVSSSSARAAAGDDHDDFERGASTPAGSGSAPLGAAHAAAKK